MNIAINDYGGFPFPFDLSRELVRRGHQVRHSYSMSSGGPISVPQSSLQNGLEIQGLGIGPANKDDLLKRWYQELRYGREFVEKLDQRPPKLILSANTKLLSGQDKGIFLSFFGCRISSALLLDQFCTNILARFPGRSVNISKILSAMH